MHEIIEAYIIKQFYLGHESFLWILLRTRKNSIKEPYLRFHMELFEVQHMYQGLDPFLNFYFDFFSLKSALPQEGK